MTSKKEILHEMWSRQQIGSLDIDYDFWSRRRELIYQMSRISRSCLFTVDVFKKRYDFASDSFSDIFGYNHSWIKTIQKQGDLIEDRIHPDDRDKMADIQIKHGQFIYSLSPESRNDYRNMYQFRMLNAKGEYMNVISRQEVIETDRNGKAWMVLGMMDISPDQMPTDTVKYSAFNRKTGEIVTDLILSGSEELLTNREKEILRMICQGLLSKEIACQLNISINTVNNHRKNILHKLHVDNSIEAVNLARNTNLLY